MRTTRLGSVIATSVLTLSALGTLQTSAYAYNVLGCKYHSASLKWGDYTTTSGYGTAATNSTAAWTNTPTVVVFTKSSTGDNVRVTDGNFGNTGYDGITLNLAQQNPVTYSCSSGYWTETLVTWWNTYYADGYGSSERQDVMVHELGHALGLAHTSGTSCSNTPIMQPDTATRWGSCGLSTPQTDDISGVNFLY